MWLPCAVDTRNYSAMLLQKYNCQLTVLNLKDKLRPMHETQFRQGCVTILHDEKRRFDAVTKPQILRGRSFRCDVCGEFGTSVQITSVTVLASTASRKNARKMAQDSTA